jgi:hypothetical protein
MHTEGRPYPKSRFPAWALLVLAGLVVGAWYGACVTPDPLPGQFRYPAHRYHALQAEAWLQGRLDLPMAVPPGFAELPDPYEPAATEPFRMGREQGIHDLSYYRGKLYLYWGPVPALVAFLPWRVITGGMLDSAWAGWAFAFGGWLASAVLVLRLARRHWPGVSPVVLVACLLALATCSWAPIVLRRSSVYEIPILAAACFGCVMWWLLAECGWAEPRRRIRWLAGASLALGLAVGSRPIWIACAPILLWPLWPLRTEWRRREFWLLAGAAVVPVSLAVGGLLLLNFLRFDHLLEFGQQWQVAGVRMNGSKAFALGQAPYNLWQYLFSSPQPTDYFPFLTEPRRADPPAGYLGLENTFGLLVVLPWLWLAAFTVFRRGRADVVPVVAMGGAAVLGILCLFNGAAGRYQAEIAAPFALLAACGALQMESCTGLGLRWRRVVLVVFLGASVLGAVFLSSHFAQVLTLRFDRHPRLEAVANRVATWLGWCPGDAVVAVEMLVDFRLPTDARPQGAGALLASGIYPFGNSIGVGFPAPDKVLFQTFRSYSIQGTVEVTLDRSVLHRVRIELGSLLPPDRHPFWDNVPAFAVRRRREQVRILCDGVVILNGELADFPPGNARPEIGFLREPSGKESNPFPGRILDVKLIRASTP